MTDTTRLMVNVQVRQVPDDQPETHLFVLGAQPLVLLEPYSTDAELGPDQIADSELGIQVTLSQLGKDEIGILLLHVTATIATEDPALVAEMRRCTEQLEKMQSDHATTD